MMYISSEEDTEQHKPLKSVQYWYDLIETRRRWYHKASIYYAIMSVIHGSLFHVALKFGFVDNLLVTFMAYISAQSGWIAVHLTFHLQYITRKPQDLEAGFLLGYVHHYYDPLVMTKYWTITRLGFFLGDLGLFAMSVALSSIASLAYFNNADWTITSLYALHALFWWHLVTVAHEWYHWPVRQRRETFCYTYPFLQAMETIGIFSTERHKKHHSHRLNELTKVRHFEDHYIPEWMSDIVDVFFEWSCKHVHEPLLQKCKGNRRVADWSLLAWGFVTSLLGAILTFGITFKLVLLWLENE